MPPAVTYLSLAQKERAENSLAGDLEGLSLVQSTLQRLAIAPATSTTARDEEVGGNPCFVTAA